MNADEHRSLGGQYGVQGFPTIKIFGLDKKKPEDYNGQRTAQVSPGFSVADLWRVDTDPDPRIRTCFYSIRILVFSSVTIKTSTINKC